MSAELIAVVIALLAAWRDRSKKEAKLAAVCEHAIAQSTELLGRQTSILESVVVILNNLSERVDDLEAGEEEVQVVGFHRAEDEEEVEVEEEGEEEPLNVKRRPTRGRGRPARRG